MASSTTGLGMAQPIERRQPIRSVRLRQRGGVLHAEELQGWHRHWREPYRFMLAIPWPGFLLSIAASYLLLNLAFTLLYALDLDGIGGAPSGQRLSVLDAFFFSVQTLGSIGYGVLHPVTFREGATPWLPLRRPRLMVARGSDRAPLVAC
jgi:inward rectifier potassium channel